jgi:hypothetical protein
VRELISLTHNFTKLLSKLLASRLGPHLDHIISTNQITFIRKRSIHGNFVYVQEVIKDLHKRKIPYLFIKLDISKTFDSVNWPYLLHILSHLGELYLCTLVFCFFSLLDQWVARQENHAL